VITLSFNRCSQTWLCIHRAANNSPASLGWWKLG